MCAPNTLLRIILDQRIFKFGDQFSFLIKKKVKNSVHKKFKPCFLLVVTANYIE